MTTFTEGPEDSVKIAVHREAGRRKRAFRFYLLLLIVPIAIGAYAIAKAPTEAQAVAKQVIPVVNANVEESIQPKVAAAVERQAEPIIRETVNKQLGPRLEAMIDHSVDARVERALIGRGQDPEIAELKQQIAQLQEQVKDLQARVRQNPDARTSFRPVSPKPQ